jgi:regulator of replication initiation timing
MSFRSKLAEENAILKAENALLKQKLNDFIKNKVPPRYYATQQH